jgi:hypothetical protein
MSQATEHLHRLATVIGPRPATTDAEAEAADYIESVFRGHGMDVERQEFDCPRTYGWAYALYHLLTVGAAVASGWEFLRWPAFAVAALVAFLLWMDLDTRFGLTGWLPPKGPSQNIIARHTPKARRGERQQRVVIVAHYDTAKASLAFSPSMVANFSTTFALMKWLTIAVPVFVLAGALPATATWDPWFWYVTIAVSAYLVVPLVINVHREVAMPAVDGANDNASGVAVMLGVMERIVPSPDDLGTTSFRPVVQGAEAARAADVIPEGAELQYSPAGVPGREETALPDDFKWAESAAEPGTAQARLEFETIEFDAVGTESAGPRSEPSAPEQVRFGEDAGPERQRGRKGLLGRFGRKRSEETRMSVAGSASTRTSTFATRAARSARGRTSGTTTMMRASAPKGAVREKTRSVTRTSRPSRPRASAAGSPRPSTGLFPTRKCGSWRLVPRNRARGGCATSSTRTAPTSKAL